MGVLRSRLGSSLQLPQHISRSMTLVRVRAHQRHRPLVLQVALLRKTLRKSLLPTALGQARQLLVTPLTGTTR